MAEKVDGSRPWLLVLLDRFSRAVLAYLAVWAAEINQYDVLRPFKKAIQPWRLPELTLPGAAYIDGAGMPSEAVPNCAWALWDNLANDNALAFCAKAIKDSQTRVVGGTITYGRYRSPNDQAFIESFFHTLESQLQRLPNTVGSGPNDPRRQEPERAARTYHLDQEVLDQVLAMAFAN
jgi:transposase InsO family protein